ncbi:heme oxygenase 2 isoform X1 [Lagopus leucura]|uniref:heme oxygenase 2 isoform X1 n=2 Tax=Lagopus leucura TaxID=30410 RepID=UPI001C66CA7C|nr:heme oxygenase 2 isoform X1 [Lagopus leucura]
MVSIGAYSLNWCADLLDCGSGRQKWCLLGLEVRPSSRWSLTSSVSDLQNRPAMPSVMENSEGGDEGESLRYEEMEDDNVSPTDLSELLKEGTKESHDRAENTQFVKDFLKGRIKKELFKLATTALYFTYSALEEEMDRNKDNPVFAPLYFPLELHRKEALIKDMKYFYGEDWKEKIQCSDATQQYVDRIHHVGQHEPELLVAHAYTRYMGDLSGGQVLKKVAQRALKLPITEEGIQFYTFENISNAQKFKQLYRARLNALDLDKNCKERIVEEANRAFRFNMEVFDELDKIGQSLVEEAQDGGVPVHDGKGDVRKCPYYADKLAGSAAAGCPYHTAVALAKQPIVQLILAACVAVAAGVAVWYVM